jgi:hypothetical protein
MKPSFPSLTLAAMLAAASPLAAQDQNSEVIQVSPDMFLRWYGHSGRTYFVQISDPNNHLRRWIWAPIIETGNDEDLSYEVDGTADKGFFRLWFTDEPTADPDGGDFDGDGLSNLAEVLTHQTNPLKADTDGDGLLDGWEIANSLDPNDDGTTNVNNGGSGDPDNDGLTNAEEQDLGTDPNDADSDDDGITDGGENDQGTDPNNPDDTPDAEWVILTGDLDEDEQATKTRTVTIPAGQRRLVLVAVASDEYPYYTGDQSEFNDTLTWNVSPSTGNPLTGNIDVNARHTHWETAEQEGLELQGFAPTHVEEGKVFVAPDDSDLTVTVDLSATNIGDGVLPSTVMVGFLPFETAPEFLAVNSNFDEGRIDPATGYAIPDCDDIAGVDPITGAGNTLMALEAVRAHLDGTFTQHQRVTNDLHQGWFGVPITSLNDAFWDDAQVTIRKVEGEDPDTGFPQSGQVRFYAKWGEGPSQYRGIPAYDLNTLQGSNLVTGGINGVAEESVYGSSSGIPNGAIFYMEGVRPGKITLEWRYQKGDLDIKHEQTFQVETHQSVAEWRDEVRYQIRLQTKVATGSEVDVALYHPGNGFRNTSSSSPPENDNVARVQAIYYYYQQLFKQMPEKFMWAGMAKTAAAPIYAGMSDLTTLWQVQELAGGYGAGTYFLTRGLLCGGQKAIFTDKAWAHRAYMASGIWALHWTKDNDSPEATDFDAWDSLDVGIHTEDQSAINLANRNLLQREQRDVVQEYYTLYATTIWMNQPKSGVSWIDAAVSWLLGFEVVTEDPGLGANVGEWLSANSKKNPMPGGPSFRDIVPGGRIDSYNDRWAWTSNPTNGMLEIWTGDSTAAIPAPFNAAKRMTENNKTMYSASSAYSFDSGGLPIE